MGNPSTQHFGARMTISSIGFLASVNPRTFELEMLLGKRLALSCNLTIMGEKDKEKRGSESEVLFYV